MSRVQPDCYCLACYASLPGFTGASQECPHCGEINLRADRTLFWTRERLLTRVEGFSKLAIVLLLAGLSLLAIRDFQTLSTGAGWAVAIPLVALGVLLWQTASLITHKPRYSRIRLTWTLVFVLFPPIPVLLLTAFSISAGGVGWSGVPVLGKLAALFSLPFAFFGWLVWRSGPRLERWKQERIARGRELSSAELVP